MARKRKRGRRLSVGAVSTAHHDPRIRDFGTPEAQAKRTALVGENERASPTTHPLGHGGWHSVRQWLSDPIPVR